MCSKNIQMSKKFFFEKPKNPKNPKTHEYQKPKNPVENGKNPKTQSPKLTNSDHETNTSLIFHMWQVKK
jgi:hypothetical protein